MTATSEVTLTDWWETNTIFSSEKYKSDKIISIAIDVLRQLVALHAEKRVHGDITPDTILIGKDGAVRLVDRGSSCPFGEHLITHTPEYASPPVAAAFERGEPIKAYPIDDRIGLAKVVSKLLYGTNNVVQVKRKSLGPRQELLVALTNRDTTARAIIDSGVGIPPLRTEFPEEDHPLSFLRGLTGSGPTNTTTDFTDETQEN